MENTLPQNSQSQMDSETPVNETTNSNSLKFVIVALLVLLPVVGISAYYFGKQSIQPIVVSDTSQTFIASKTSPVPDAEEESQIIKSETPFGLSLIYPSGWKKSESTSEYSDIILSINEVEMKMADRGGDLVPIPTSPREPETYGRIMISLPGENQKTIEEMAKSWRNGETKKLIIGGQKAIQVVQQPNPEGEELVKGGYTVSVFTKNVQGQNILFQLETANLEKYQPVFQEMLNSVSFEK